MSVFIFNQVNRQWKLEVLPKNCGWFPVRLPVMTSVVQRLLLSLCAADGGCQFEQGLCSWQNARDDDFDWMRKQGRTSSSNTGPSFDHTKGAHARVPGQLLLNFKLKQEGFSIYGSRTLE